jgi:hypothetical protein
VRDRFSQARGIVDFTLTRLAGNAARGVPPFLDQPWGELLTPDTIVDHFADLFEVQPEFLPIAQQLLPSFRREIPQLFTNEAQQALAWRLVKLVILVHLSPRRESLEPARAAEWLAFRVSSMDPDKNRQVIARVLDTLAREGACVKPSGDGFVLDLEDDGREQLERLLARTIEEVAARGDAAIESLGLTCFPAHRLSQRRIVQQSRFWRAVSSTCSRCPAIAGTGARCAGVSMTATLRSISAAVSIASATMRRRCRRSRSGCRGGPRRPAHGRGRVVV